MKNNVVIYTCRTGNYDRLLQPMVVDDTFDYICFSDSNTVSEKGVWVYREIPKVKDDEISLSRYPKMFPHLLLPEYDYSVYIDANIVIQTHDFYDYIRNAIKNNYNLAGIQHPDIKCLYDEYFNVFYWQKEVNLSLLKKEYRYIESSGFPKNYGFYEANIIFRNHKSLDVAKQSEEWWGMWNKYAKRDQLSYSFTLWRNGIPFNYLMPYCGFDLSAEKPYRKLYHETRLNWKQKAAYVLKIVTPKRLLHKLFYTYMSL